MNRSVSHLFALVGSLALAGCSSTSADRTAYEAMQNVGQQDCRKDPSATCPKRQSYNDYEEQRKTLELKR